MDIHLFIYQQLGELNILVLSAKKKSEEDSLLYGYPARLNNQGTPYQFFLGREF
jgi:hypothetical protein